MLVYLHKKDGGLLGIEVAEIERFEDITEAMEQEARKYMDGYNQTARATGREEEAVPHTTAGGSAINGGQYHVTETAEEIRNLLDAARKAEPAPMNPGDPIARVLNAHLNGVIGDHITNMLTEWKRAGERVRSVAYDIGERLTAVGGVFHHVEGALGAIKNRAGN
jgi:hypothetical protein